MDVIAWLLDSDPAIRWQVLRDLTDASDAEVAAARACVPYEGLGAAILTAQGDDGAWHLPDKPDWLPTLFMMQLLRATGADPQDPAVELTTERLQAGFLWAEEFGAKPFAEGEVEPCINGGALAASSYFGRPSLDLAQRLVNEQLEDGGWNCEAAKSRVSSFHSTICVLEGLLEFEEAAGRRPDMTEARHRGEEYLLKRGLFRRLSTGEVANPRFLELAFPPRYHYDVLRALDYFRAAGVPDQRMSEAVEMIERKRQPDGRWLLERAYDEALSVPTGERLGEPSRWIALRAMRVLRWWAQAGGAFRADK